jgi:N-acyl-D-amino-acid deacylase
MTDAKPHFDLRIIHGEVIDGTGAPRRRSDVGIRGDTIVEIGDLSSSTATVTIDAAGQVVTPGFIDLLGQSEGPVLMDPHLEGKVRQGVTTEVTGEGRSPGPLSDEVIDEINRTRPEGYPEVSWRSLGDFMRFVEKRGTAINFAFYVGATNAREIVLGRNNKKPTREEMRRMEEVIDQGMKDGAVGLSSALVYVPAVFASTEELTALARIAARHGGGYFTHMRSESGAIDAALEETFRIGRDAAIPVEIFHLKIGGRHNWGRMPEIVRKIEAEQKKGLRIAADIYPYTATGTGLTALVPSWALEGGYDQLRKRLQDPVMRKKIAEEIESSAFYDRVGGARGILIRRIPNSRFSNFERKRLDEIASAMGVSPVEAVLRLFESADGAPTAIYFSLNEEDLKYAMKQPWVSVGSDSGAVVGVLRNAGAHPRAYGSFPRVLGHYVRDAKLFSLEEAVRKVTSQAASRVHITDRGTLKPGMKADLVVFDPATIADKSTYEDPHHFSVGISNVVVNGSAVLRDGTMTDALPGRVLRHAGAPQRKP